MSMITIIGAGAAGLQLALQLAKEEYFSDKQILLVDKDQKQSNDHTWSYWEKGEGDYDNIISNSWKTAFFANSNKQFKFDLSPYSYQTLSALKFYDFAREKLKRHPNITWINDEVLSVNEDTAKVTIKCKSKSYESELVFDSRFDINAINADKNAITLWQHFKGWFITTEKNVFNPAEFTVMDYRISDGDTTSFTYILPFTSNSALIEFTYFTPEIIDKKHYDKFLKEYIKEYLKIDKYQITEAEYGVIPMTNYNFQQQKQKRVIKIGTAGGWVKPSTGYSFTNSRKKAEQIVDDLIKGRINGKAPYSTESKTKYKFYDKVFLKVLKRHNHLGPKLFSQLYEMKDRDALFRFLDEESTFIDDLKVISAVDKWPFLRALF